MRPIYQLLGMTEKVVSFFTLRERNEKARCFIVYFIVVFLLEHEEKNSRDFPSRKEVIERLYMMHKQCVSINVVKIKRVFLMQGIL